MWSNSYRNNGRGIATKWRVSLRCSSSVRKCMRRNELCTIIKLQETAYPSAVDSQRSFLGSMRSLGLTSSRTKSSTTTSGVVVLGALITASSDDSPPAERMLGDSRVAVSAI